MRIIKFGILEAGIPPVELKAEHGSYPDMFKDLLSKSLSGESGLAFEFKYFHVLDGEIPANANACDAWLITGSKHGVYEQHEWIAPMISLVQDIYRRGIPLVGICFGHQLIAQALGGKVIKSDKGWSLGVQEYQLHENPAWMEESQQMFSIQAYHQDQVVELPENTQVLASSTFCPFAALNFNDRAISFQGHPEFDRHYTKKLLTGRRDLQLLPLDLSNKAIESVDMPIQPDLVAKWIAQFIRFKFSIV